MWTQFHTLRVSDEFLKKWNDFLSLSGAVSPTLFQHVTQKIFEDFIKDEFHVDPAPEMIRGELTEDDQSALRYVAGYVCRKLKEKLEKASLPDKNDLILNSEAKVTTRLNNGSTPQIVVVYGTSLMRCFAYFA